MNFLMRYIIKNKMVAEGKTPSFLSINRLLQAYPDK